MGKRILVVDDEPIVLALLQRLLRKEGFETVVAKDGPGAVALLGTQPFDLLLSDICMEPMDGMELFRRARVLQPDLPVVLLTAHGTVETAIEATQHGAFDYLTKPIDVGQLTVTVKRALDYAEIKAERDELRETLATQCRMGAFVAESAAMHRVCEQLRRLAPTEVPVLLTGERGTGKKSVAKALHAHSRRREKPLIRIGCAALPEPLLEAEMFGHVPGALPGAPAGRRGLFETAAGGTLLLDEVAALPPALQGKLARALKERAVRPVGGTAAVPVDVRILAASETSLDPLVRDGAFRKDLHHRLAVIVVDLPPLRDRPEDILPLMWHFLRQGCGAGQTCPRLLREAAAALTNYGWPGNVGELEQAARHALAFAAGGRIGRDALPPPVAALAAQKPAAPAEDFRNLSLRTFLRQKEKEYLERMAARTHGSRKPSARPPPSEASGRDGHPAVEWL